ncbi:MAG: tRNA (adenosine(37)-N6)-dimethylallyltransferase MiaA [Candidatus Omnitrophica bacterium]|nr:tRNA (adenosine(37)-N6)-dimethylallyltransferase MiaA [Candidatus Omnitrophota bacterium]
MKCRKPGRVVFIVGPTAIGKSAVATALAKKIDAEIISCDSMQVYKGMRIISSYPDKELLKSVRHHLIADISPSCEFNASKYRSQALRKIKEIIADGKVPILAGGTGLYMSVLIDGIFKTKSADTKIRECLYRQAEKNGSAFLHKRLKKIDPQAAVNIHPNDARRIIRALEIFESTGKPISLLQKERKGLNAEYDIKIFCLNTKRDELYRRIDSRVDKMFKSGLLNEAKKLLKSRLSKTSRTALGIREVKGYLDGAYDLEEAKQLLKLNTRHYAKRQLTWFRKDKRIEWIEVSAKDKPEGIARKIIPRI